MPPFDYWLSPQTRFIHKNDIANSLVIDSNRPLWLTLENEKNIYGTTSHSFQLQDTYTSLKLINIMHPDFHNDFTSLVFQDRDLSFDNKCEILAPLGLPSFTTQMHAIDRCKDGVYDGNDNVAMKYTLDVYMPFVGNHHRYSVMQASGRNLDMEMVKYIMSKYSTYSGYIAPELWPSCHHGGFISPEVCIFKPNILQYQGVVGVQVGRRTRKSGKINDKKMGGFDTDASISTKPVELPESLKKFGWKSWDELVRPHPICVDYVSKQQRYNEEGYIGGQGQGQGHSCVLTKRSAIHFKIVK